MKGKIAQILIDSHVPPCWPSFPPRRFDLYADIEWRALAGHERRMSTQHVVIRDHRVINRPRSNLPDQIRLGASPR